MENKLNENIISETNVEKPKFSSRFFENGNCEYFPCHENAPKDFNCLFCYCPLHSMDHCPGKPEYIEYKGRTIKNCTSCTFPHDPANYDIIMNFLKKSLGK